jgi:hypothetical protein
MRRVVGSLVLTAWLLFAEAPASAQPLPPPAQSPKPPEAKKEEPNQVIHYTLAAIAFLIVMVLVCMPARRD